MSIFKIETECLERIRFKYDELHTIVDFLESEKLISMQDRTSILKNQLEISKNLRNALKQLERQNISVIFTWQLLPSEIISIDIITENKAKNFMFGG